MISRHKCDAATTPACFVNWLKYPSFGETHGGKLAFGVSLFWLYYLLKRGKKRKEKSETYRK